MYVHFAFVPCLDPSDHRTIFFFPYVEIRPIVVCGADSFLLPSTCGPRKKNELYRVLRALISVSPFAGPSREKCTFCLSLN